MEAPDSPRVYTYLGNYATYYKSVMPVAVLAMLTTSHISFGQAVYGQQGGRSESYKLYGAEEGKSRGDYLGRVTPLLVARLLTAVG